MTARAATRDLGSRLCGLLRRPRVPKELTEAGGALVVSAVIGWVARFRFAGRSRPSFVSATDASSSAQPTRRNGRPEPADTREAADAGSIPAASIVSFKPKMDRDNRYIPLACHLSGRSKRNGVTIG